MRFSHKLIVNDEIRHCRVMKSIMEVFFEEYLFHSISGLAKPLFLELNSHGNVILRALI